MRVSPHTAQAEASAIELAKGLRGDYSWDRGGWPTNSPDVTMTAKRVFTFPDGTFLRSTDFDIDLQQPRGFSAFSDALADGPVYGFYEGPTNQQTNVTPAHIIVITGIANAGDYHPILVTSNNPWGHRNIQPYGEFIEGIPRDTQGMTFQGIIRVNPGRR